MSDKRVVLLTSELGDRQIQIIKEKVENAHLFVCKPREVQAAKCQCPMCDAGIAVRLVSYTRYGESPTASGGNYGGYVPPQDGDGKTRQVWDRSSMLKKLNGKKPWEKRR